MSGGRTLALLFAAILLACDGGSNGTDEPCEREDAVRLGAIISLTGGLGTFGPPIDLSVDVAADEINKQGGVLGRPLCIQHADDATDTARAKSKAEEMVADQRITGILGGLSSGSSVGIRDVTGALGMMQISCCSTSPALTAQDNFYRTAPSDALQARVLARKAIEQNYMTVGIIYLTGPYGEG